MDNEHLKTDKFETTYTERDFLRAYRVQQAQITLAQYWRNMLKWVQASRASGMHAKQH